MNKTEKSQKNTKFFITLFFIELCITLLTSIYVFEIKNLYNIGYLVFFVIAIILIITSLLCIYLSMILDRRHKLINKEELEEYSDRIKVVAEEGENTDILEKMKLKLVDIKEYYSWSRRQAKISFIFSMIMSVFGLLLVFISVIFIINGNIEISISLVTAIGGILVELLSGFVLILYKNSMVQLNYYHQSLHEDERFLSSISLVKNLSDETLKNEVIIEIIKSELELNIKYMEYLRK